MNHQPKAPPLRTGRVGAVSPAFEFEIHRHSNGRVASLKVHVGRSFGALILSVVALWRGNDLSSALKGLISFFGR
jgi:sigma54-dependent transcription regulator